MKLPYFLSTTTIKSQNSGKWNQSDCGDCLKVSDPLLPGMFRRQ